MTVAAALAVAATLSLVIGAALGLYLKPSQRVIAAVMAFGSGALIQALAVELAFESAERLVHEHHIHRLMSWLVVAGGFLSGGLAYYLANRALERRGGALRSPAMAKNYLLELKRQEWGVLLERLSGVELLRSLPPEEMQAVLPYVHPVEVRAGQAVFRRGEPGDALYLIDHGKIDILRNGTAAGAVTRTAIDGVVNDRGHGDTARLATLSRGDSFGEMALLSGEPRTATAVAAEDATLLRIGRDDFDHLLSGSPALRRAVEELNTQRLFQNVRAAQAPHDAEQWQRAARRSIQRVSVAEQEAMMREQGEHGGAPLAIFMGALLDGIPESIVIGASFVGLAAFNPTFLMAVFMSNLPEAMSSAAGMRAGGFSTARIFTLWGGLVVGSALAAAFGNAVLPAAPPAVLAFVEALAGGGILAMVASTMMPEAFEHGGASVGLSTIAGFLAAFFFTALSL